jgi:mono/diheme cytochrome c family protein
VRAPLVAGVAAAAVAFGAVSLFGGGDAAAPTASKGLVRHDEGRSVFARMGCGNCHRLAAANATGQIGPDLGRRLRGHTRASLREKILDPYPELPEEVPDTLMTIMPRDYGERMSDAELDALISFLLRSRAAPGLERSR